MSLTRISFAEVAKGFEGDWVEGGINAGKNLSLSVGSFIELIAAQATVGGVFSELQGGKFGHGFVSAGVVKAFSPVLAGIDTNGGADTVDIGQAFAAAIVGGTASELSGGKFANGAITSAFQWAFSQGARKVQPTAKPNITGSDKTAFVGGAADDTFGAGVVRAKYEAFIRDPANSAGSARYFEWTDADALSTYVADNQGRVTIVAHSYGADEAAHLVAGGMQVYKLVTVDPVGWTRPNMQSIANNAVIWNNFDSSGSLWGSWNNAVATFGGAWNSRPNGFATSHKSSSLDHVSICSSYCNP